MRIHIAAFLLVAMGAVSANAQLVPYGQPTPPGFQVRLHSNGQVPYIGNPLFNIQIAGSSNPFGGILGVSPVPGNLQVGSLTFLVDLTTVTLIDLPVSVAFLPLPLPFAPSLIGATAFGQVALSDPTVTGGVGLTNGIALTIMPDRTPTRAYFTGQDFSMGANAPGQLAVMDLTTVPPSFRATGPLGFGGDISSNFAAKISVSEIGLIAYALGNGTTNQFVRLYDISGDPLGVVAWPTLGDIPIARDISSIVGWRDMEVLENNGLLFVTSGPSSSGAAIVLDVFDVSNVPLIIPTAPIQSISFPNAGGGTGSLDLSPDNTRLAVCIGADNHPALTIYDIDLTASQPLSPLANFGFQNMNGNDAPNDASFSPDGTLVLVSAGNGSFGVVDMTTSPPSIALNGGTWTTNTSLGYHGSATALYNGSIVGVLGEPSSTGGANYNVIDLNITAPTFSVPAYPAFTTNPNGNISNHRSHARQNMVIAIDGTGATVNCQWVDVIDFSQTTVSFWRVKMPSSGNLTPGGLSCIPRDFDMF